MRHERGRSQHLTANHPAPSPRSSAPAIQSAQTPRHRNFSNALGSAPSHLVSAYRLHSISSSAMAADLLFGSTRSPPAGICQGHRAVSRRLPLRSPPQLRPRPPAATTASGRLLPCHGFGGGDGGEEPGELSEDDSQREIEAELSRRLKEDDEMEELERMEEMVYAPRRPSSSSPMLHMNLRALGPGLNPFAPFGMGNYSSSSR